MDQIRTMNARANVETAVTSRAKYNPWRQFYGEPWRCYVWDIYIAWGNVEPSMQMKNGTASIAPKPYDIMLA